MPNTGKLWLCLGHSVAPGNMDQASKARSKRTMFRMLKALIVMSMLTENLDQKKAGPVRKVASEPQGLQNLERKERNGQHCNERSGQAAKPRGPLALPPIVFAAMDMIEEGHTNQCQSGNGEALPATSLHSSRPQSWSLNSPIGSKSAMPCYHLLCFKFPQQDSHVLRAAAWAQERYVT